MSVENFIPQLWAAPFLVRLRKALVYGGIANREYEGVIRNMGDTVNILEVGPVAASSYTKGSTLTYSDLDGADKQLLIDQATEFHFKIDDVDRAQTMQGVMEGGMSEGAYAVADTIDQFIAGKYTEGVTQSTTGNSSADVDVSSGNVIEQFSYVGRYLTDRNVPTGGRWGVIPPFIHQKLLLAEVGGISATAVPKADRGSYVNGFIGQAMGFNLFVSNNVQNDGTEYYCMFGNNTAISYAGQLTELESFRLQTTFATAARGLYVYGAKVVRPNALHVAYWAEASG
jgi:hypothetical protein